MITPFHFAFKVKDLDSTRAFYIGVLGCKEGRSTDRWIDFDLFGHQLSAHVSTKIPSPDFCGLVDGIEVPIPHFGCILNEDQFDLIEKRLIRAESEFLVNPQTRYAGKPGEQRTLFVLDPSQNALEFKCYKHQEDVFKSLVVE